MTKVGYCCNCKYKVATFIDEEGLHHCGDCGSEVDVEDE